MLEDYTSPFHSRNEAVVAPAIPVLEVLIAAAILGHDTPVEAKVFAATIFVNH